MQKDLQCMEFVRVDDLTNNNWENGILFINGPDYEVAANETDAGCFSSIGRAPGYTGSNDLSILKLGAKSGWQIIVLSASLNCHTTRVVQHETMHALGFSHEFQRPDRDDHIVFNASHVDNPDRNLGQFTKLTRDVWEDIGSPFEIGSVMMYGSGTRAIRGKHTMTLLNDGGAWPFHTTLTTTDALQVQAHYCLNTEEFPRKASQICTTLDRADQQLRVFNDRLCDNKRDCPNGEDEGEMKECEKMPERTQNGCCSTVIFHLDNGPIECTNRDDNDVHNSKDAFICEYPFSFYPEKDPEFKLKFMTWWNGTTGWFLDTKPLNSSEFWWYDRAWGDVQCPDDPSLKWNAREGANWTKFGGGRPSHVACKVKGVKPIWREWSVWSTCSVHCGESGGVTRRVRQCEQGDCKGSAVETFNCNRKPCREFFNLKLISYLK